MATNGAYYSEGHLKSLQEKLRDFLRANGPCTKAQIREGLGWKLKRIEVIVSSRPEWLKGVGIHFTKNGLGKSTLYGCEGEHVLGECSNCGRRLFYNGVRKMCQQCVGTSPRRESQRLIPGVDVSLPTTANPGSEDKVRVLEARFDAGLPLWNDDDEKLMAGNPNCYQPGDEWDEDYD